MNSSLTENNEFSQNNDSNIYNDHNKINSYNIDNSINKNGQIQNQTNDIHQNLQQHSINQEKGTSPRRMSNQKPPLNGNRSSENSKKIQNVSKIISTLSKFKQRNDNQEENTLSNKGAQANQQLIHYQHSHNQSDMFKNLSQQKTFQEKMISDKIRASEKAFVVGRIKTDDSRLASSQRKNKTEMSFDEQEQNQDQENEQNLLRSTSNLRNSNKMRNTKGSSIRLGSTDKNLGKNRLNNSQTKYLSKNTDIKDGYVNNHQKNVFNSSGPSQIDERKNTAFFNDPIVNNDPLTPDRASKEEGIVKDKDYQNNQNTTQQTSSQKNKISTQMNKTQSEMNKILFPSKVKLHTEGDQTDCQEDLGKYFNVKKGEDEDKQFLKNNRNIFKLCLSQQNSSQSSAQKKQRMTNKEIQNEDNKKLNLNKNDSSISPIDKYPQRQIRSYSSKGFATNKSSEKMNKSINKINNPQSSKQKTQNDVIDREGQDNSDSHESKNKINKQNLNDETCKKRSSQSYVNIQEKKLIDNGLNLKKFNNMDLILSKITKTHNLKGNPYQDPLTQQIFTKQFTQVFVKKIEEKRKNLKQTDYDYVDAAKVYYSVSNGSNLAKQDIGRGQKYLLDVAQKQQSELKKNVNTNSIQNNETNQNSNQNTNYNTKNQNTNLQLSPNQKNNNNDQPYFNPSATFSAPFQSYVNLPQSVSSPTILATQKQTQQTGNLITEPETSQQNFRVSQNNLSPQKKFQPLFLGSRNNTQAPVYFNFVVGNDFQSNTLYPISTSTTKTFYPHSHFHRINPFQGMTTYNSQRDKSPFNISYHNYDTQYGEFNNNNSQDLFIPERNQADNMDQTGEKYNINQNNENTKDNPQSSIYNNNDTNDKTRNPTLFTSTGKLILPRLQMTGGAITNMDPDLQNVLKCQKMLEFLNDDDLPNSQKKKKKPIDSAEREKSRQRLLGKDKASQVKSIRQMKEEERNRQEDEKFNIPIKRGKKEMGSVNGSHPTVENSIVNQDQQKSMTTQMKPKIVQEYQNFMVNVTQNYNETISIVLKKGYPEENDSSLLKVDQLSKDNFKNFQWKFDEAWFSKGNDNQRYRVLKGRDEKIKQKCSFHFFNCTDLVSHKEYLQDVSISYMINLQYEKDRVRNPTLLMYSIPNIFQQNKKEMELVTQQEYYSTLECILEYRYQIRQEWEEEEMISIFYSLIDCMYELQTLNICHGNITPAHIAYSYKTNRYKIFNFSSAQVYHKDYKGGYPIYYQWPFLAPEVKKGLNFMNNRSNRYDIMASDMYSLGICLLFIKYLIPETLRSQDAVNRLISTVESDHRLSAQIIRFLINKQSIKRIEYPYQKICHYIQTEVTSKGEEFNPYQKQDLVHLNPLHKLKWKQIKESEVIADFYYRIFQWQNAADRMKKMLDELTQIEQSGEKDLTAQQKEKKQKTLRDVWKSYYKQQEYDNAVKYNQMYMDLISQTPTEKMQEKEFLEALAEDLKMTGQLYFTIQKPEQAIEYFEKSIQVLNDLYGANHIEVISMLNNIGVLYKSLQNYAKAIEYFQEALKIMEQTRQTQDDLYFFIKYNIGIIFFEQEELTQAENILYDIYKIKTTEHRVKSVEVSQYAYVLGNVYIKKSQLPKAQQIFEAAIKMRESCIGYDGELIKWKQLLANVCFQLGQRKEAMDILIKTVADVKKLRKQPQSSNPEGDEATYNAIEDIGNMILESGNKQEAFKFYHEALQLAKNSQEKQKGIINALEKKIKEVKK